MSHTAVINYTGNQRPYLGATAARIYGTLSSACRHQRLAQPPTPRNDSAYCLAKKCMHGFRLGKRLCGGSAAARLLQATTIFMQHTSHVGYQLKALHKSHTRTTPVGGFAEGRSQCSVTTGSKLLQLTRVIKSLHRLFCTLRYTYHQIGRCQMCTC